MYAKLGPIFVGGLKKKSLKNTIYPHNLAQDRLLKNALYYYILYCILLWAQSEIFYMKSLKNRLLLNIR